ncbi:hypothetical protein OS242_10665 [Tumebacillus sp. DT12]|uniref:TrbC/VirB2 family protein n=1 Tax=Tumebacillus lacus TaxID=2995335 RepID=A0ABT3X0J0_9BACL|nr:hypothetical protein [Tumebacillus lacus]MCX7570425.1 hypothetical protein [Tumebacillus lacus]
MKTQTLDWKSFMRGEVRPKMEAPPAVLATVLAALTLTQATSAQAAVGDKIVHAFDPLINVVQSISYPVCFLSMAGGMLLIMVGQRHRGITMIKWSAIGYVGMQMVPSIMGIVADVGRSMK